MTRCVKWQSDCPNVRVGELVLLWDDTVWQDLWPLGRTENIYPGRDGIVCVVDVWTKIGVYRRPIVKIYPVEEQTFNEVPQGGGNVQIVEAEGELLQIIGSHTGASWWSYSYEHCYYHLEKKQLGLGKNNFDLGKTALC